MAPLLRGRFASKGSGEDPEGDLSPPGMRRSSPCGRAGLAIDGAPVCHQVRRACAPCKRKTAPLLRSRFASKGSGEDPEGALSLPRVCAEAAPAAMPVMPSTARPCPLQAEKRPRFCGTVSRQREVERIRRATSLSLGYAQKQPLRQCRSCHRRRARPPSGPARPCPLQAEKRPRFCGAVSRQREAERIWRAISFARALDTSCSGVSPR